MQDLTINSGEYIIGFEYAESKSSIKDLLLNNRLRICALLGEEDYYSSFMMIKYRKAGSLESNDHGVVGLLYNTGGYEPHIIMLPSRSALLIGFNESLAMYDMSKNDIAFTCSLPSPSFYCRCFKEGIVVLSELDITEIAYSGEILKRHALREILGNYRFSDLDLIYRLYDGSSDHIIHLFESE